MAHIQLVGMAESKSPDGKLWKIPYAFPIIIAELRRTRHTFGHLDTYVDRLSFAELNDRIMKSESRIYGISAWSHNYTHVKELARNIRRKDKDATIIVGGILSGNDTVLLEKTDVDIVATAAEGEFVLPELLDVLDNDKSALRTVKGISFRDPATGSIVRTPRRRMMNQVDFQKRGMPAYDYFEDALREISRNLEARTDIPVKAFPVLTSRGCPFHCTFCGHLYRHRMLRKRWELLVGELEHLSKTYGFTGFYSYDTNMFLNEADVDEYCRIYDERGLDFKLFGSLRLSFGNPAMYEKLAAHGFSIALFGLETGSQDMLRRMKKKTDHQVARTRVRQAAEAGILIHGNFIFGTPGESVRTIRETRDFMFFLERLIADQKRDFERRGKLNTSGYGWTILIPSPTSELYDEAREEGLITDEEDYLASLSDDSFHRLLKGSSSKIALAQEAGTLNMSEFTSRRALAAYIHYNWNLVKFLAAFYRPEKLPGGLKATASHALAAATHYCAYLYRRAADFLAGRKGYTPRDKRPPGTAGHGARAGGECAGRERCAGKRAPGERGGGERTAGGRDGGESGGRERAAAPEPDQAPGQTPGQAPDKAPGQASGQTLGQTPGQAPDKDCLVQSILCDELFLSLRAEAVAAALAATGTPRGVVLYGCGALARALADRHGPALREAGASFVVTDAPREASFRGFPLGRAALLPPDTPRVLLLSGSYEAAMREELAFLPPPAVTGLEEAVRRGCTEALLDKARARILQEAEGLAAELRERFPDPERIVCFIDPELTMPYLETYARLRGQGHAVVLLSRSHVPSMVPGEEMVARGYADFFHQAPSLHFLWVLAERLCGLVRFGLVNLWCLYYTFPLVNRVLAGSLGPVAVWLDSVLTQVIRVEGPREFLLSTQGIDLPRAHELERALFARAGGVVSRIPPRQLEETRALHASDAPCLTFHRPLLPAGNGHRVRPPLRGRPPRVIFVCSLHTRPDVTSHVGWTLESIHEAIAALTGQGVEFSIFNPLDVGGGYEALRRAAGENPLLRYSPAIHPEALLEEMAAHDFVWLARRVEPGGVGYHRTHLPLTLFQAVAAGTPVIVSPELAYLGELTRAHNLGFTLPHEDWGKARERMEAFDMERCARDIRLYRDALSPEHAAERLAAFYETVRKRHKAVNGHAPGPR